MKFYTFLYIMTMLIYAFESESSQDSILNEYSMIQSNLAAQEKIEFSTRIVTSVSICSFITISTAMLTLSYQEKEKIEKFKNHLEGEQESIKLAVFKSACNEQTSNQVDSIRAVSSILAATSLICCMFLSNKHHEISEEYNQWMILSSGLIFSTISGIAHLYNTRTIARAIDLAEQAPSIHTKKKGLSLFIPRICDTANPIKIRN